MDGDQGVWNHLKHGEILTAIHDAVVWGKQQFQALPAWMQTFINKTSTQEYTILQGLVSVGVPDVIAGGFSTASFVKAGKDIWAALVAKNISTFTMQDVMANLNAAVASDPTAQALNAQNFAAAVAALASNVSSAQAAGTSSAQS